MTMRDPQSIPNQVEDDNTEDDNTENDKKYAGILRGKNFCNNNSIIFDSSFLDAFFVENVKKIQNGEKNPR